MQGNLIGSKPIRRLMTALAMVPAIASLSPASAENPTQITDRARFVSVTRDLEKAPLDPALKSDREWALQWLTDVPDITVTICADPLGGMVGSGYLHSGEVLIQYMFSMAAGVIEHPEIADDKVAQQIAGVESALAAYRSIIGDKSETRSPALDAMLASQARGELPAFVEQAYHSCIAKGREEAGS